MKVFKVADAISQLMKGFKMMVSAMYIFVLCQFSAFQSINNKKHTSRGIMEMYKIQKASHQDHGNKLMVDKNLYSQQTNSTMIMIILCGIPGTGKSTFARRLVNSLPHTYQTRWDIYNQDVLGSRKNVEISTIESLRSKRCVIIDRCNFDEKQRITWIDLGHQYNVNMMISVVLPDYDNVQVCSLRAFNRGNDGIHENDVDWNMVCNIMKTDFKLPTLKEGVHGVYQCNNEDDVNSLIKEFQLIASKGSF